MEQEEVLCFRCGAPAIGKTAILTGTKDGVPKHEAEVAVCEDCYTVLKQKVRTRSKLSDQKLTRFEISVLIVNGEMPRQELCKP